MVVRQLGLSALTFVFTTKNNAVTKSFIVGKILRSCLGCKVPLLHQCSQQCVRMQYEALGLQKSHFRNISPANPCLLVPAYHTSGQREAWHGLKAGQAQASSLWWLPCQKPSTLPGYLLYAIRMCWEQSILFHSRSLLIIIKCRFWCSVWSSSHALLP